MGHPKIYSYDPKKDGWKKFPDADTKKVKVDGKMRGIKEWDIPLQHYVVNGVAFCGETEPTGSTFYNDPKNQCDGCRAGLRKQTIRDKNLLAECEHGNITEEEAEAGNVLDYKAAAATDKPETSKVSH